jgi:hypothetical protein
LPAKRGEIATRFLKGDVQWPRTENLKKVSGLCFYV